MGLLARLLGPLTRLARNPTMWKAFTSALSKSTKVALTSLDDVINWAKNNKGAAVLILSNLSVAGISLVDFFKDDDGKVDPDDKKLIGQISQTSSSSPEVFKLLLELAGADGDDLKAAPSDNLRLQNAVVAWAKDFFGAPNNVLMAHLALQAFIEIPHADLVARLSDRVVPVPAWGPETQNLLKGL